ncbi:MAG TPA: TlpA disulfide reductase family protein [Puia sp.]|nr:TlpA disulfide reductase family protein [Puia sp.]
MRRQFFLILTPLLVFLALSASAQEIRKMKIGELQSFIANADHPLIINFWATYCVPCAKEIPYFERIVKSHAEQKVELVLVSLDLPAYYPKKIAAFVKKENYSSAVFWLNEFNADYFCPKVDKTWTGGIPSSLFVNNKSGYRRFFERQLTEEQAEKSIEDLVK